MQAQEQLALYGCSEPLPARWPVHAGALHCELVGGRFGPVHAHGHEVWHGLAFLLRDAGWGTPEPVFDQVRQRALPDGVELDLHGHIPCAPDDVHGAPATGAQLRLHLQLRAHHDGRLDLSARAEASHDLRVNRCGWVLMHPLSAAGCALEVTHVDGRCSRSSLPLEVPAWPPFMGVRALRHEYAPGHWAEATLPGEDYELEDQRNNADASFKTYSRSNLMPRPFVLRRGQPLVREMRLRLLGQPAPAVPPRAPAMPLPPQPVPAQPAPRLGLAITPAMAASPAPALLDVLRAWRPGYLQLTLWQPDEALHWPGVQTLLQAAGCGLRLDLCGLPELGQAGAQDAQLRELAAQLQQAGIAPEAVAAFPCGAQAAALLRSCFAGAAIGGGTPHYFAQLNRLEGSGGEDFMAFTVCPIVHGAADGDVMQGLRSLPSLLDTARRRHPGRAWQIGPSGLAARASPLGAQPASDGQRRIALARQDPRTRGLFGAAWLLGHLAGAVHAGVQALSLPPLVGEAGLGTLTADGWHGSPSAAWLAVCLRWSSLQALPWQAAPVRGPGEAAFPAWPLAAIAGRGPQGWQVLLANLQDKPCALHWPHGGQWSCLDAAAWVRHQHVPGASPWPAASACGQTLTLGPYALARIDLSFGLEAEHAP